MKASIKDIAMDTGLSIATVSKYLRNVTIRTENKLRIEEAINRLGYVPNRNAQMLRSGKTYTIGVVIADLSNSFWGSIVDYIEEYLQQHGYMTVIYSGQEIETEGRYLSNILAQNLDGLIIVLKNQDHDAYLPKIERRLPIVLIDQKSTHYPIDTVTSDNYGAGKKAANYLMSMGHTRIGIITAWRNIYTISERLRGFLDGVAEGNCHVESKQIVEGPMTSGSGKELFARLMRQELPPEVVFSTNLDVGLGALVEANMQGYRIGKDISFISIDDDELFAGMIPPITVVTQDVKQIGFESARLLLDKLNNKTNEKQKTIYIETELIVRDSVSNKLVRDKECQ
ncbi:MAG: LacI family DNA-binding transcriptional regulator [Sphaerochaetaceae bacterium]